MRTMILLIVLFQTCWAEETQKITNIALIDSSLTLIDKSQNFAQDSWRGLNYSVDSFFSDKRYKAEENESKVMASWTGYKTESKNFQNVWDLAVKIHLPQITKRLSITFEKERDEIVDATNSYAQRALNTKKASQETKPGSKINSYAAAATILLTDNPYYQSDLRTGIKLLLPLDPFLKLSIYNEKKFDHFNIGAEEKLILYRQDGFSEFTSLRWGYLLNSNFHLSQNNVLAWRDTTDHFTLRNDLSLGQALFEDKGLTYTLGANALLAPSFHYTKYDVSVSYRQKIFSKWLYGSLSTGAEFLKEHRFKQDNFIQFGLEIL